MICYFCQSLHVVNADGENDNKTTKYRLNFQSYGLVDFVRKCSNNFNI